MYTSGPDLFAQKCYNFRHPEASYGRKVFDIAEKSQNWWERAYSLPGVNTLWSPLGVDKGCSF
jgi:hypothetical protein